MLFSIVIPTFNRAALLARTLESVWAQHWTEFEVIVVDDGSTDGTAEFVRGLGGKVQLVTQSNLGPGAGRNNGARLARGEYLAFLDSDDLWFPWTLANFAELIRRHTQPAILGAKLMEFSDEVQLVTVRETPMQADVFEDFIASHRSSYFVGAGMSVLRREEFLKTGGFTNKPINAEDHDLILRMGAAPGFVQVTSPVTLAWRRHAGSATTNLSRTVAGSLYLVEQERLGAYPGGPERARERRRILTRHARPATLDCLQHGLYRDAWKLYRALFRWHVMLGRWKYLLGFPVRALKR
jgi:glycosyltransferase involved in cell wall biosynthesis